MSRIRIAMILAVVCVSTRPATAEFLNRPLPITGHVPSQKNPFSLVDKLYYRSDNPHSDIRFVKLENSSPWFDLNQTTGAITVAWRKGVGSLQHLFGSNRYDMFVSVYDRNLSETVADATLDKAAHLTIYGQLQKLHWYEAEGYSIDVYNVTKKDSEILAVRAKPILPQFNLIEYRISSFTNTFFINPSSGMISLSRDLDPNELPKSYHLTVSATYLQWPSLFGDQDRSSETVVSIRIFPHTSCDSRTNYTDARTIVKPQSSYENMVEDMKLVVKILFLETCLIISTFYIMSCNIATSIGLPISCLPTLSAKYT